MADATKRREEYDYAGNGNFATNISPRDTART